MRVIWQSSHYSPEIVERRYVRAAIDGGYRYCLVDKAGRDVQQGEVDAMMLPRPLREAAALLSGQAFPWLEWHVSLKELIESLRASILEMEVNP